MMRQLFGPETSEKSFVFKLKPGQTALLWAVDFDKWRYRASAQEVQTPQVACLHKLLYKFDMDCTPPFVPAYENCDCIFDVSRVQPTVVADNVVWQSECPWNISACDNYKVWDMPGFYYLQLNDETAVGKAQVYLEILEYGPLPYVRPTPGSLV